MCENKDNTVSLSDVIIAGICTLQEKNGVSACEIAEYVAKKRSCKLKQIEGMIKMILCKAIHNGILCEKRGRYHISPKYDDLPKVNTDTVCLQEETENSDEENDDDDDPCAEKCNPCATLTFSKNDLEDDEDDDCRNLKMKEMNIKEKKPPSNRSVSELILSAVYFLQKKNGVTVKDITKYICQKRGFKQSQMRSKVKEALDRGTRNGIFNLKRGLYKVGEDCRQKLTTLKKKVKKKTEANKIPKKIIQKKISMGKNAGEEKRLTPIKECPKTCTAIKDRTEGHKMSEDIFDRRGRENSYFEPSLLARPSDEEYDDYDDEEDDNEDDENSEMDEGRRPDIFMFTVTDDPSHERFPELNIYSAARDVKQEKMCTGEKKRNNNSVREKGKKPKASKSRKKKCSEEEKKKSKRINSDDSHGNRGCNDDEYDDDDDDDLYEEDESDYSEESDLGKNKGNKFTVRPKAKKREKKEKTHSKQVKKSKSKKEVKEFKEAKDSRSNAKKKGKQEKAKKTKKHKRSKRESLEENRMKENQESLMTKSERSLSNSNCLITSSTKLLPSDFKLSISPNPMISDVKFSPTNVKFESRDSSTLLLCDKMKNESTDQSSKKKELFDDFEILCEFQSPKRKHLPNLYDLSLTKGTEPIKKRIRSQQSQK